MVQIFQCSHDDAIRSTLFKLGACNLVPVASLQMLVYISWNLQNELFASLNFQN